MNGSSPTIGELAKALAAAQAEFPAIPRSRTANAGTYSYNYADLGDILDAVRPVLSKHELAVVQPTEVRDEQTVVCTKLLHSSGEWVGSSFPVNTGGTPQQTGSALTYARRYTLTAMLGIATEEDDDAQSAGGAPKRERRKAAPKEEPKSAPVDIAKNLRIELGKVAAVEGITQETAARLLAEQFDGKDSKALDPLQLRSGIESFKAYGELLRECTSAAEANGNNTEELLLIASDIVGLPDVVQSLQALSAGGLVKVRDELRSTAAEGAKV